MTEYQRRIIQGTFHNYNSSGLSGNYPPIQVCASGHVITNLYGYNPATGAYLPIVVNQSGCVAMCYCASGGIFS